MKVVVSRQLTSGQYIVRFGVSDFTAEEITKMNSFGVPQIQLRQNVAGVGVKQVSFPLTQINMNLMASFSAEEQARQYEEGILTQIRNAMASLRDRKDDFTATQEVVI